MRQLMVVLAVVAVLGAAVRWTPQQERILPLSFSADFPEHREHHEQLLRNLGQKPLKSYPGDVVRLWWVGPNPQELLVIEPDKFTRVEYSTAGYTPRVTEVRSDAGEVRRLYWMYLRVTLLEPELWRMSPDPGLGPFTVGGLTWILEMKLGDRYRIMEKIDPKPELFARSCRAVKDATLPRQH